MTDEIAGEMAVAEESIQAAELLISRAFFGIAASQAYFGMWHAARALLALHEFGSSKHCVVIAKFGEVFAETGTLDAVLHRSLVEAFEIKQIADYDHSRDIEEADARIHIAHAKEFLAAAREYLQQHNADADT